MCIHKIEIEITIVVVVEESDPTSECFRIKSSFFIFSAVMLEFQSELFGDFRKIPANLTISYASDSAVNWVVRIWY